MKPSLMIPALFVIALLGLAACAPAEDLAAQPAAATATVTSPTATPLPTQTAGPPATQVPTETPEPSATPALPPLTLEALRNAEYTLPVSQKTVKLEDGTYEFHSGAESMWVRMIDPVGSGDMNGDGAPDAAVVLGENTGGSGVFESLVLVLNQDGKPSQAAAVEIGDRVTVKTILIQDGRIGLEMLDHGPNDPLCCASQPVKEWFRLTRGGLFLDERSTQAADGTSRAIQIQAPAAGSQVGSTIKLSGAENIAPFENNLVYRVYDENNQQLAEGSITAQSDGAGGPASFSAEVSLPEIPQGAAIWLEVMDLSPADGATLALASVRLEKN